MPPLSRSNDGPEYVDHLSKDCTEVALHFLEVYSVCNLISDYSLAGKAIINYKYLMRFWTLLDTSTNTNSAICCIIMSETFQDK